MKEHANNLIRQGCVLYLLVKPVPRPRASSRRPVFRVVWVQHILDCLGSFRLFDSRFRIFGCSGGFHCGLPSSVFSGFGVFGFLAICSPRERGKPAGNPGRRCFRARCHARQAAFFPPREDPSAMHAGWVSAGGKAAFRPIAAPFLNPRPTRGK